VADFAELAAVGEGGDGREGKPRRLALVDPHPFVSPRLHRAGIETARGHWRGHVGAAAGQYRPTMVDTGLRRHPLEQPAFASGKELRARPGNEELMDIVLGDGGADGVEKGAWTIQTFGPRALACRNAADAGEMNAKR